MGSSWARLRGVCVWLSAYCVYAHVCLGGHTCVLYMYECLWWGSVHICIHVSNKGSVCVLCTCTDVFLCLCTHKWLSVCVIYIHIWGFVCVACICIGVSAWEQCVLCTCMYAEGQYVYVCIYMVSMYEQCVHDCKGKVCVVGQCVLCLSVTVGGSVWLCMLSACIALCGIMCVLCASHVLCGAVHMWYVLGPHHPQVECISLSTQSSLGTFRSPTK